MELLAPAGSRSKLNTALRFGADAVYIGGSAYGLRAYADNFDDEGIRDAIAYAHALGKKVYVTVNIFASNRDFAPLTDYLKMLEAARADAVIVTDAGVVELCKKVAPALEIHLSTQANTTNGYAARFWAQQGVKRIVLSRELPLSDIIEIRNIVGNDVELEVFVHGAMCISYSGRCLLSSYLTSRDSNRGECVQACRWEYAIAEVARRENPLTLTEDAHGSYILNSKDLNMLPYVGELIRAGVDCFKIEGRMKSEYYVASVVNAYRRAIDGYAKYGDEYPEKQKLIEELDKVSHRGYTTGLYFENKDNVCSMTSKPEGEYVFAAEVIGYDEERGAAIVEQRNRFKAGDELEVLSPDGNFLRTITVDAEDGDGNAVSDCKYVQQVLYLKTSLRLAAHDILRLKSEAKNGK